MPATSLEKPRESRAHTCPSAPELFRPAPLPCQTYKLRPTAGDAQAVAVDDGKLLRRSVATPATLERERCCHRRCWGAAAGRDRQQATEGARDLADRPEEGGCSPASSLPALASQRACDQQLCLDSRTLKVPLRRLSCLKPFLCVRVCECVWLAVSAACTPILYAVVAEEVARWIAGRREAISTRESTSEWLPTIFTWPQLKVSPRCFPSYRRTIRVCVRSRRDIFR